MKRFTLYDIRTVDDGCGVQVCRSERYDSIVLLDLDDSKKKLGEFDTIGELKELLCEFGLQSSLENILDDIETEEDYYAD